MSKKIKYIVSLIITISVIIFAKEIYAATANISTSANTVTIGDTITITISGNAASWSLELSGATSGNMADATTSGENENVTMGTYTYKTTKAGEVTFKLTGTVVNSDYTKQTINTSKTVTVKEQTPTTPNTFLTSSHTSSYS